MNSNTQLMQQDFTAVFERVKNKVMQSPFYQVVYEDGGSYYEGEIKAGKKHGVGVHVTQNGETYEGYWDNSVKKGFGKYTFSNGDSYIGNFDQNRPNGHGKMDYFLSGNVYEGNWKEGKATG